MKVYTKTGDKGTTSLIQGTRVSKANIRIETYGTVDELNSWIGLLRDQAINKNRKDVLVEIQDRLFTMGSSLASDPEKEGRILPDLFESDIEYLENQIDQMNTELPPMRNFILAGGHQSVSFCHVARTVCRRAERLSIRLAENTIVEDLVIKYLNRLSDYLFVLSRKMSLELDAEEIPWKPRK